MIDGTEKPQYLQYAQRDTTNLAVIMERFKTFANGMSGTRPWSHPSGRAVSNVNFLAQELITLIAKDKEILYKKFMWFQELIRKTQFFTMTIIQQQQPQCLVPTSTIYIDGVA